MAPIRPPTSAGFTCSCSTTRTGSSSAKQWKFRAMHRSRRCASARKLGNKSRDWSRQVSPRGRSIERRRACGRRESAAPKWCRSSACSTRPRRDSRESCARWAFAASSSPYRSSRVCRPTATMARRHDRRRISVSTPPRSSNQPASSRRNTQHCCGRAPSRTRRRTRSLGRRCAEARRENHADSRAPCRWSRSYAALLIHPAFIFSGDLTLSTSAPPSEVGSAPAEGRITDQAIADAKAMIGLQLRPEGPYLQDATPDTLRNWCNGIGDLNPLYRAVGYGAASRYGSMLAHPMFPMAFGWLGRTRWGLPGVHGFYAGNDWEVFRNLRPGDRISAEERVVAVDERQSEFSGRLVIQYVEAHFVNQHDDLIARVLGWCTRHERKAARDKGKYKDIQAYEYTPDELHALHEAIMGEESSIRGENVRYWEDVRVGEELP